MNAVPLHPMVPGDDDAVVRSASRTHVGRVRAINEDRIFDCADRKLWAVVDGMGGHQGGDLAAQTVVDELRRLVADATAVTAETVQDALFRANTAIFQRNRAQGLDAGATVVVALVVDETVRIGWAGDSRAYRLRSDGAELLTQDHSVVQELVSAGLLTPDMADRHPQANVITRALGVDADVALDWITVDVAADERLMLCSDGLSRSLDPAAPDHDRTLDQAVDALLEAALRRDGSDNISVVVIERMARQ